MSTTLVKKFDDIYGISKSGKTKLWTANVYQNPDGSAYASMEHGFLDGKKQTVIRDYTGGKNIGRKNETSPTEQCLSETERKWLDKCQKEGYKVLSQIDHDDTDITDNVESDQDSTSKPVYYPMLTQTYDPIKKRKNNIEFPCLVQPKLDGIRCIAFMFNDKICYQSRTNTDILSVSHLDSDLKKIFKINPDIILDGELYTTKYPFEKFAGLIKKKHITETDKVELKKVEYCVYDVIDESVIFKERLSIFKKLIGSHNFDYVKAVETEICQNSDNVKMFHAKYMEEGYEGIILRNIDGFYKTKYRSYDLQKYKEFVETEYRIIGYKEGSGRDQGTVIWVCQNSNGQSFSVRPKGSVEHRSELLDNAESYIGKFLTVIYQELSDVGIPRFPVGKDVREHY